MFLALLPRPADLRSAGQADESERGLTFLLPDGGVLAVGERAGRAVAQTRDVVLIPAEVLTLGPGQRNEDVTRLRARQ